MDEVREDEEEDEGGRVTGRGGVWIRTGHEEERDERRGK